MLGQVCRGMKRPLLVAELTEAATQRQSILDISMCKLQTIPVRKVEPSLRRSVLIFNTLKHIELELRDEGVRFYPTSKTSLIPAIQTDDSSLEVAPSLLNNHGDKGTAVLNHPAVCENNNEDSLSSARLMCCDSDDNSDLVRTAVLHCEALTNNPIPMDTSETSPLYQNSDVAPVATPVSPSLGSPVLSYHDYLNSNTQASHNFPPQITQSFEEMLSDLDLTVYDMDMLTVSSSPKLTPLSGDDLDLFAPLAMPINCKSDFMFDDLDNILQQVFVVS